MNGQGKKQPVVFRLTSVWKRAVARLIDFFLINFIFGLLFGFLRWSNWGLLPSYLDSRLFVYRMLTFWVYEACFLARTGQTVGKMVLRITVVSEEGRGLTLAEALLRIVSGLVPFEFLLCLVTSRKQCLHDLLARTVVVDKQ